MTNQERARRAAITAAAMFQFDGATLRTSSILTRMTERQPSAAGAASQTMLAAMRVRTIGAAS